MKNGENVLKRDIVDFYDFCKKLSPALLFVVFGKCLTIRLWMFMHL